MGESRFLGGEGQAALPPTKMQLGSDLLTLEFGSITGCVQDRENTWLNSQLSAKPRPCLVLPKPLLLKPGNGLAETKRKSKGESERATANLP